MIPWLRGTPREPFFLRPTAGMEGRRGGWRGGIVGDAWRCGSGGEAATVQQLLLQALHRSSERLKRGEGEVTQRHSRAHVKVGDRGVVTAGGGASAAKPTASSAAPTTTTTPDLLLPHGRARLQHGRAVEPMRLGRT